jgi:hypothetical protein
MKKTILSLSLTLMLNFGFAQLLPTGTSTTDNKYRVGGLGLGYSTIPTFGTNKFLVNGNSYFTGNIGIGIQSPTSKLHIVNGDLRLNNGKMYLGFTPPTSPILIDGQDVFGLHTNKSILIHNSNIAHLSVGRNDGVLVSVFDAAISHGDGTWCRLAKKGDVVLRGNTKGSLLLVNEKGGDVKFITTADPTNDTTEYFTTKTRMLIDKSGNIGIGTGDMPLNPNDLLAVNGLIHAKEVKVDLVGWPDYVFENDYNLIPLNQLESKINELGHLPNVPSAKDVENNGVNLGEMNKKLLEKVEELTLYVIQLNKDIEKLKTKVE